jgi:hypothetical protein
MVKPRATVFSVKIKFRKILWICVKTRPLVRMSKYKQVFMDEIQLMLLPPQANPILPLIQE